MISVDLPVLPRDDSFTRTSPRTSRSRSSTTVTKPPSLIVSSVSPVIASKKEQTPLTDKLKEENSVDDLEEGWTEYYDQRYACSLSNEMIILP